MKSSLRETDYRVIVRTVEDAVWYYSCEIDSLDPGYRVDRKERALRRSLKRKLRQAEGLQAKLRRLL